MIRQLCWILPTIVWAGLGWNEVSPSAEPSVPDGSAVYLGRPLEYWTAAAAEKTENPATILGALTQAFRSGDLNSMVAAADGMQALGPQAAPAAGLLTETLDHIQPWVRTAAMDALAAMGSRSVPALVEAFETGSAGTRVRSAMVLGAIGPDARAALPVLQAAASETDAMRRRLEPIIDAIRGPAEAGDADRPAAASFRMSDEAAFVAVAAKTDDWPQFRGPGRDGISAETGLLDEWPEAGPPLLWQLDGLGKGYSSVSIAGGTIFTMGDRIGADGEEHQYALAFDLETRRELWATRVGPPHSDGPRCTPTWDAGVVYVLGTAGDLLALQADSGQVIWQRNLPEDFGGVVMSVWRFSESPLVDGDRLICTPGGPDATMVALDKRTGETIWKCAMPPIGDAGNDGAGYSSAVVAELAGVRQYVQLLGRGVIGVDAQTGRFLWGYNRIANSVANIPSPVVRGDYVFTTTSYQTGCALLHIQRDGDRFRAEEVYFLGPRDFENHHGGVILLGDYVYGGDGQNNGHPTCLKLATGQIQWKERGPAAGSAAIVYADGHLIFRYDRGPVALIEATPEALRIKSVFDPVKGSGPAWAHPVIHHGRLVLRHGDLLACYDLRARD
jgi:outer membrane protein assembly factor BamB